MISMLLMMACGPAIQKYDISSAIIASNEDGLLIQSGDVEICQTIETRNDTDKDLNVSITQCYILDIENGVALLPNWEGEYAESDETEVIISVEIFDDEESYSATLLDNDEDVWCDNEIPLTQNESGAVTQTTRLCEQGFESYMLWQVTLPINVFSGEE